MKIANGNLQVSANIVESATAYESGIVWKAANERVERIGGYSDADHVSAKITVWGSVETIALFRLALGAVSGKIQAIFSEGENPFGPAFDCKHYSEYLLMDIDDVTIEDKETVKMSFQLAALWTTLSWAHDAIEFSLANFAVQKVKRESEESKTTFQKESDWSAFRHNWRRPKFTLSLLANSQAMGGTIRWLTEMKGFPFLIVCNKSMFLINTQQEKVKCLSFGNLRRLGNSNFWQADFDFVRAA
jgi:hypothetical protein